MARYAECKSAADKIRAQAQDMMVFADWLETEGVKLGKYDIPWISQQRTFSVYLTATISYQDEEDGNWKSRTDDEKTKHSIARFLDAVGTPVEKDYQQDTLYIRKKFGAGNVILSGSVTRELVCTKKVVAKKWVEPRVIDGHFEEEVEWDCETSSLLALVKE